MNNWVEICSASLTANLAVLQHAVGRGTRLLAVVKANAYGHGAEVCAVTLVQAGAEWLGVTCAGEGVRVRTALNAAGLDARILIMSGILPQDVASLQSARLTPVIWTHDHLRWLAAERGLNVHVEVDTGMGRQGATPGAELASLLQGLATSGLVLDGLFTHFCSAEEFDCPLTRTQQSLFEHAVAQVREAGMRPTWLHAGNSSTVDNPVHPCDWLQRLAATLVAQPMVRTGLALYGYCLPVEAAARPSVQPELRPVMTWKARVLAVRALASGETVGYNATFHATSPMRVALLPAGYADGLRRELSSTNSKPGGWVILRGQRAPILGRVSMNLSVVDITGIPGAEAGNEAILLGPGITADDHARLANTIAYEILCGIHPCS